MSWSMPYTPNNMNGGQIGSNPTYNNQLNNPYYNQAQAALERLERLQNEQNANMNMGMNVGMGMNNQKPNIMQQAIATSGNLLQVSSTQQARDQEVDPNTTLWMKHSFLPIIYAKSVSNMGTIEFQPYQLVPFDGNIKGNVQETQTPQTQVQNAQYVPIEDFNNLSNTVKQLNEKITMYEGMLLNSKETKTSSTSNKKGGNNNESTK